jgi:hypothetical protein
VLRFFACYAKHISCAGDDYETIFYALIVISIFTPAAASPRQFNLSCRGDKTTLDGPDTFKTMLRVNLTTRRYCFDKCDNILLIKEVNEKWVIFESSSPALEALGRKQYQQVNRRTGKYISVYETKSPAITIVKDGICTFRPFVEFPRHKTIF